MLAQALYSYYMQRYTHETIHNYISSKALAWSPTTQRSELARLRKALPSLKSSPLETYNALKDSYKPYSLKTLFIRLSEFSQFVDGDTAGYKAFMRSHANLFKNAYSRKQVSVTYEEALVLIEEALTGPEQQAAKLMLSTGLRIHEALKYDGSGSVVGKGAKLRPVFSALTITSETSYFRIYRKLAKVGLKPHDLRKLAATRLAASGELNEADLMEVMGWSNITTASNYLQPARKAALNEKVMRLLK